MIHEILEYLKHNGDRLETEIAAGTGISLANVRRGVTDLSASGDVIVCHVSRFKDGKQIDGTLCRVAGFLRAASPGRKPKA